jgi:protein-L-isoaspartate(D-aspartate) O-methyltransferase
MKHLFLLLALFGCYSVSLSHNNKIKKHKEKSHCNMNDTSKYRIRAQNLSNELKRKGISDRRVLDAIRKIPRHRFVVEDLSDRAYEDRALPIEKGQTISQPYTVAFQTELLRVKKGEKILEIGTGSGYQAAVLCEIGAEVYSIERIHDLHIQAKNLLNELGYNPVLVYGDGYEGLPEQAPFDKILVTAATKERPETLIKQLRIGGWMVAPMGDSLGQKMKVIKRVKADKFVESEHGSFIFVPMKKGTEK